MKESERDEGGKKEKGEKGDLHLGRSLTKSPEKDWINKQDFH